MSTTQQILWGYLFIGIADALGFLSAVWAVNKFGTEQAKAVIANSPRRDSPLTLTTIALLLIPLWPLTFVAIIQVLRNR